MTRRFAVPFALVAAIVATSAWGWARIDGDRIPTHFNVHGEVDGYGGRFAGLVMLPLIALGATLLMAFLPRIDPRGGNLARSGTALVAIAAGVNGMLLIVQLAIVLNATGHEVDVTRWVTLASGVLFVVLGNYMSKIRSNFFVGIRTPWTLSNERVWVRTHRLGARVFVGIGLVVLVLALLSPAAGMAALAVGSMGGAIATAAYSYVAWREETAA